MVFFIQTNWKVWSSVRRRPRHGDRPAWVAKLSGGLSGFFYWWLSGGKYDDNDDFGDGDGDVDDDDDDDDDGVDNGDEPAWVAKLSGGLLGSNDVDDYNDGGDDDNDYDYSDGDN